MVEGFTMNCIVLGGVEVNGGRISHGMFDFSLAMHVHNERSHVHLSRHFGIVMPCSLLLHGVYHRGCRALCVCLIGVCGLF